MLLQESVQEVGAVERARTTAAQIPNVGLERARESPRGVPITIAWSQGSCLAGSVRIYNSSIKAVICVRTGPGIPWLKRQVFYEKPLQVVDTTSG